MAAEILADTGALLALLDKDDLWHQPCVQTFRNLLLPLLTSEAVLTELFHLIGDNPRDVDAAWKFISLGTITVAAIDNLALSSLHALMMRYADRPMDFADATLVYLAERESLTTVFTVDHSDFETYRIGGHRRFRILPTRGSR